MQQHLLPAQSVTGYRGGKFGVTLMNRVLVGELNRHGAEIGSILEWLMQELFCLTGKDTKAATSIKQRASV